MSHHHVANSRHRAEQRYAQRKREIDTKIDEARKLVEQAESLLETSLAKSAAAGEGMLPGSGN